MIPVPGETDNHMLAGSVFPTVQCVNVFVCWFFLKFGVSLKCEVAAGSPRGGVGGGGDLGDALHVCSEITLCGFKCCWYHVRTSSGNPDSFYLRPGFVLRKMKIIASMLQGLGKNSRKYIYRIYIST